MGPVGTFDHSGHPPMTTQDNNDMPEVQGSDITTYGESNLVAEPQKVKMKPRIFLFLFLAAPTACRSS